MARHTFGETFAYHALIRLAPIRASGENRSESRRPARLPRLCPGARLPLKPTRLLIGPDSAGQARHTAGPCRHRPGGWGIGTVAVRRTKSVRRRSAFRRVHRSMHGIGVQAREWRALNYSGVICTRVQIGRWGNVGRVLEVARSDRCLWRRGRRRSQRASSSGASRRLAAAYAAPGMAGGGGGVSKARGGCSAPDHRYPCLMCRHFDGYIGACFVVEGSVRPDATCDHWQNSIPEQRGSAAAGPTIEILKPGTAIRADPAKIGSRLQVYSLASLSSTVAMAGRGAPSSRRARRPGGTAGGCGAAAGRGRAEGGGACGAAQSGVAGE